MRADSATTSTRRRQRRSAALLLATLALAGLAGCASPAPGGDAEHDYWPLYYRRDVAGRRTTEVLWPFFEWRRDDAERGLYFHPLYNRRNLPNPERAETQYLYPFGGATKDIDHDEAWFWPLLWTGTRGGMKYGRESRFALLPFIYYVGHPDRPDEPDDVMVFPFYARLHHTLKRDKIVFYLWPLYTREWSNDSRDRAWSALFILLRYERFDSEPQGRGYKFWPFYGHSYREGKNAKTFILWPLYNRQWVNLDQGGRWESTFYAPFYGRESSPAGHAWVALWPFFGLQYQAKDHRTQWDAPWPVFGRVRGDTISAWRLWPLFLTRTEKDRSDWQALWPIVWSTHDHATGIEEETFRIVPLVWQESECDRLGRKGSLFQLWPLFRFERDPDGTGLFELPSVLPSMRRPGFYRNYGPFCRLLEWHRRPDGAASYSLLWRLLRYERDESQVGVDVWPLVSWRRGTAAPRARLTLLKGLLGYERGAAGRDVQLLYLFHLRWGGGPAGEVEP